MMIECSFLSVILSSETIGITRFQKIKKYLKNVLTKLYLRFLLSEEEGKEMLERFEEFQGDNPDYNKMPLWKYIYENVEVRIKR